MDVFEFILKLSAGSISIAGIIIYLGKIIINRSSDIILENHKNKLDLMKIEHQVKFSKLSEERGVVIKEIYNALFVLEERLAELTTIFQGPEWVRDKARVDAAWDQLSKTQKLLEVNRIFFSEHLCNDLEVSLNACRDVILIMINAKNTAEQREELIRMGEKMAIKDGEGPYDLWLKAREIASKEIKEHRLKLAGNFRELIGVN